MHWTDHAIVLSTRKFGENKALSHVFSRTHGLHAGMVAGITSKTNRGVMQAGNIVNIHWNARLSEQIGMFKAELLTPNAALVMQDADRLAALTSACATVEASLPERHPYPQLYNTLHSFLAHLASGEPWQEEYIRLELEILNHCGFGLDLTRCAATGATDDLIYVSPRSGRAVSREAGEPYKDKLLPLPAFLTPSLTLPRKREMEHKHPLSPKGGGLGRGNNLAQTLAGLRLTGYFLAHWLLEPHGRKLPAARQRLAAVLKDMHEKEAAT